MGLDQYAYINAQKEVTHDPDTNREIVDVMCENEYVWRKHARLQEFMERLWTKKTGRDAGELNCNHMALSKSDLEELKKTIEDSYIDCESPGGFFYGHQHQQEQMEEYYEHDMEFVTRALKAVEKGETVLYSCWW